MRILVTGASGLIGRTLCQNLKDENHEVFSLVRRSPHYPNEIFWNPEKDKIDFKALEALNIEGVVHLAGEGIANKRWNEKIKKQILNSRIEGTKLLCKTLVELRNPPKVLVSASAIGFYGNRGNSNCTEDSRPGTGFLSEVCQQWEKATEETQKRGIPTFCMRFGVVLSTQGGALCKMLPPFKFGLGGKLGEGDQYMSWVVIDDVISSIKFLMKNGKTILKGPVNIVSPEPVTNKTFTEILGKVLNRPTFFKVPTFILQLLVGKEMANEIFLCSIKTYPQKLLDAGFEFKYKTLEDALKYLINRN